MAPTPSGAFTYADENIMVTVEDSTANPFYDAYRDHFDRTQAAAVCGHTGAQTHVIPESG